MNNLISKNIKLYFDLIIQKAKADLVAETQRGYLGMVWWVLEPLLYMTVFYFVFVHFRKRGGDDYVMFLLTGLVAWKWFHSTVASSANSLIANAALIKQVYVPKYIFPISVVVANTVKFFFILSLLLVFSQFAGIKVTVAWLFLPIIVLLELILILSLGMLFSAIMPFFPDFKLILDNGLMLGLFISGIFFDISRYPGKAQMILYLNPVADLIHFYREIIISGNFPELSKIIYVSLSCVPILILAIWLFMKFNRIYPKIVY